MKSSILAAASLVLCTIAPCNAAADDRIYSNLTLDPTVSNSHIKWTNVGDVFVSERSVDIPSACRFGPTKIKRIDLSTRAEFVITERALSPYSASSMAVGKDGSIAYLERSPALDSISACSGLPSHVYYTTAGATDRVHIYDGDRNLDRFGNPRRARRVYISDDGYIVWQADHHEYEPGTDAFVKVTTIYEYQIPFDGVLRTADFENVKVRARFETPGGRSAGQLLEGIFKNRGLVISRTEITENEQIISIEILDEEDELSVIAQVIDPNIYEYPYISIQPAGTNGGVIFYNKLISKEGYETWQARVWKDGATYIFDAPIEGSSSVNQGQSNSNEALVRVTDPSTGLRLGIFTWDGTTVSEIPEAFNANLDDFGNAIFLSRQGLFIKSASGSVEGLEPQLPDGQTIAWGHLANDGTVFIQHMDVEAANAGDFDAFYESLDVVVGQLPDQGCDDLDALRKLISEVLMDSAISAGLLQKLDVIQSLESRPENARSMGSKKIFDAFVRRVSGISSTVLTDDDAGALLRCATQARDALAAARLP